MKAMRLRKRCATHAAIILAAVLSLLTTLPAGGAVPGYLLGPEDVLEVTVWGYPDLTRVVTVQPDGKVSLPLVGSTTAGGRSVEDFTRVLTRAYAVYINDPQVTVIIKEFRKIRVSVLGQVARPGTYPLPPGATLLDLLGAAGGVTEAASLTQAQLLRPGEVARLIDLGRVLAGDAGVNISLRGGDTLVVPEDLVNLVNVAGEVARPGRYRLKGDIRVLDALLLAGGLTEKASVTEARLVRGGRDTQPLFLDGLLLRQEMSRNVPLQPGDTLIIPEEINNKIYVIGDVNQPGMFTVKGPVTLLQAVGMAGGVTQRGVATAKAVHVVRRNAPADRVIAGSAKVEPLPNGGALLTVDVAALMRGAGDRDVVVLPGDVIVVPQSSLGGLQVILSILSGIFGIFK